MKNSLWILLALATLVIGGCQHAAPSPIELDNGNKWKVIETMIVHINTMENDVQTFEGQSMEDYQALAASLKTNIDLLTSNCTMTGKAHDELHNWLLPYIDTVDEFSGVSTVEDGKKSVEKIKTSFETFHQYFE